MARFVFLLLLVFNAGLGAYLYFHVTAAAPGLPPEVNAAAFKVVSVTDPARAQQEALAARKLAASLSGAACVELSVKPADGARAQPLFAAMNLGDRLSIRNVEEYSRYAVALPAQKDRKGAETVLANLKKAGLKDVSILGDNSISLGVYSTEESARKAVTDMQAKAPGQLKDILVTPRNAQPREAVFTVREPDVNMVARLTLLQRDFEASTLRAVACPATPPPSVNVQDAKADKAKP
ncbi:MAG TPA: hypothetical protein VFV17_06465 [Usitatibacteraceae bacterium]|nr:hypothetical protein [Usitatibacteraceae bacterium]